MAFTIYSLQSAAAVRCHSATDRMFPREGVINTLDGVIHLIAARCLSCAAMFLGIYKFCPQSLLKSVAKLIVVPLRDCSGRGIIRIVLGTSLLLVLLPLRIAVIAAGIITPELTYGVLKAHHLLAFLGMWLRLQHHNIDFLDVDCIDDAIFRFKAALQVTRVLSFNNPSSDHTAFIDGICRRTLLWIRTRSEVEPDRVRRTGQSEGGLFGAIGRSRPLDLSRLPPPQRSTLLFMKRLVTFAREEISSLCAEGIFTRQEMSEQEGEVLYAVLDRATLRLLTASVIIEDNTLHFLNGEEDVTVPIDDKLAQYKDLMASILGIYAELSANDRNLLPYSLCGDEERVRAHVSNVPEKPEKLKKLREDLVALRTRFIERSLALVSEEFQQLFAFS